MAQEIEADNREMRLDELIIDEIKSNGEFALEALGTEATLDGVGKLNQPLKDRVIQAIQSKGSNSQDDADRELGWLVRELVYSYIEGGVEDLIDE